MTWTTRSQQILLVLLWSLRAASAPAQVFDDPLPLNPNAAIDSGHDVRPHLATDGGGTWVVVWVSNDTMGGTLDSGGHVLALRSTDGGATWGDLSVLDPFAGRLTVTPNAAGTHPRVAAGGAGHWLAVWESTNPLGGSIGSDYDVLFSRSTDDGRTWSEPAPVNPDAAIDSDRDLFPEVRRDAAGGWVVAWIDEVGIERHGVLVRSADDGVTWSAPPQDIAPATPLAPLRLASDEAGNWLALLADDATQLTELYATRSTDDGSRWSTPRLFFDQRGPETEFSWWVQGGHAVEAGTAGTWMAGWRAEIENGSLPGSSQLWLARSVDAGITWSSPIRFDKFPSSYPQVPPHTVSIAGTGSFWMVAWDSRNTLGGTLGTDRDILAVASEDDGLTWSPPAPLVHTAVTDGPFATDDQVTLAVGPLDDPSGRPVVAVWSSTPVDGGSADRDLLFARGRFGVPCAGDCNRDGTVGLNEWSIGLNIAMGFAPLDSCSAYDGDQDGNVQVHEVVGAFLNAAFDCTDRDASEIPTSAVLAVGESTSVAGETVTIDVSLATASGEAIFGVQNDILFDGTQVALTQASDCRINPEFDANLNPDCAPCLGFARSLVHCGESPRASGCAGQPPAMRRFRGMLFPNDPGLEPLPIPSGAVLYTCAMTPVADAPAGSIPLVNRNPSASNAGGQLLRVAAADGRVLVAADPQSTPTPTPGQEPSPTATPTETPGTPPEECNGDLNRDRQVTVNEIVRMIVVALSGCVADFSTELPTGATRFVDNGDGTISDLQTKLMWEKKTGSAGDLRRCTVSDPCPDPHHVNNTYPWCADVNGDFGCDSDFTGIPTDGPLFTSFLATLNAQRLGGKTDWRLPTIAELETLLDPDVAGCERGSNLPCVDAALLPTFGQQFYWSVSEAAGREPFRITVVFSDGGYRWSGTSFPSNIGAARAVRNDCAGDANGDNEVTVEEIVRAVQQALRGC